MKETRQNFDQRPEKDVKVLSSFFVRLYTESEQVVFDLQGFSVKYFPWKKNFYLSILVSLICPFQICSQLFVFKLNTSPSCPSCPSCPFGPPCPSCLPWKTYLPPWSNNFSSLFRIITVLLVFLAKVHWHFPVVEKSSKYYCVKISRHSKWP